jgi:DNA modification methylase
MKELIAERMTTTTDEAGDSPLVFSTEHVKLYQGDSRLILHEQLAAESIHMCMCSPPYYGLRDYGLQPILWDGRAGCNHEFQTRHYKLHAGRGDAQKSGKYSEQEDVHQVWRLERPAWPRTQNWPVYPSFIADF